MTSWSGIREYSTKNGLPVIMLALIIAVGPGCFSISDINAGFRRLDRAWLLDHQRMEDQYRTRIFLAEYHTTFTAVTETFIDLGVPVIEASRETGQITAQSDAPTPLTPEEWLWVVREENPRVTRMVGWLIYMPKDPENYILTVKAKVSDLKDGRTLVVLSYSLDSPKYKEWGIKGAQYAPPTAVRIGSVKFWDRIAKKMKPYRR